MIAELELGGPGKVKPKGLHERIPPRRKAFFRPDRSAGMEGN